MTLNLVCPISWNRVGIHPIDSFLWFREWWTSNPFEVFERKPQISQHQPLKHSKPWIDLWSSGISNVPNLSRNFSISFLDSLEIYLSVWCFFSKWRRGFSVAWWHVVQMIKFFWWSINPVPSKTFTCMIDSSSPSKTKEVRSFPWLVTLRQHKERKKEGNRCCFHYFKWNWLRDCHVFGFWSELRCGSGWIGRSVVFLSSLMKCFFITCARIVAGRFAS